jgi:Ca-activated chloride channel family protein
MAKYNKIWAILLLFIAVNTYAQQPKTRILFVLDGSGSMYAKMGTDNRITVAKRLLTRMVDSLRYQEDLELALRVYGHQSQKTERNCKDTKLEVPFSRGNHQAIKDNIRDLRPKGTTLIAYSLQEAAYDFPKKPGVRNIIILITDGLEECDGDPCAVSMALQKQGVVLRPFVIGLGLSADFRTQFECVGRYFEAETESDFENVLNVVISQAINNTTAQVNLLDSYGRPTETDVDMTFTDSKTGRIIDDIYHTLNYRGLPDTLFLDPSYAYDVKVHTIPPVYKKNVQLIAGKHNTIAIDAAQGNLNLKIDGVTNYSNLQALIIDRKTNEIINVQDFNDEQRYIVNDYKVELLTLPRITQDIVSVQQNKITTLQVQQPGKLNIVTRTKYEIGIYRLHKGETELVKSLNLNTNQNITVMQPGNYKLIYRATAVKESMTTKTQDFTIKSGEMKHFTLK